MLNMINHQPLGLFLADAIKVDLFVRSLNYLILSMKGWVYVITNKAMPGLVKIGYSTKDPELRAKELANTGVPHPYVVEYDVLVVEPRQVEQQLHCSFSGFRESKEWFRCDVSYAITEIRNLLGEKILLENLKDAERFLQSNQTTQVIVEKCWYQNCQKEGVFDLKNHKYCHEHFQTLNEYNSSPASNATRSRFETREEKYDKAKSLREALNISVKEDAISIKDVWQNIRNTVQNPQDSNKFKISNMHRLSYDEKEQKHILIYPEGFIELNQSAYEILSLCDGLHSNQDIVIKLERKFAASGLAKDVSNFIQIAEENGWITKNNKKTEAP